MKKTVLQSYCRLSFWGLPQTRMLVLWTVKFGALWHANCNKQWNTMNTSKAPAWNSLQRVSGDQSYSVLSASIKTMKTWHAETDLHEGGQSAGSVFFDFVDGDLGLCFVLAGQYHIVAGRTQRLGNFESDAILRTSHYGHTSCHDIWSRVSAQQTTRNYTAWLTLTASSKKVLFANYIKFESAPFVFLLH